MNTEAIKQIDKYTVLAALGKGAKSSIWKVEDPADGRIYTLKRVVREVDEDDRYLQQVRTEFEVSSRVDHEYLRKSFDLRKIRSWFKTQELLLLMEYVDGQTLKQAPPEDMEEAIDMFTKIANGLQALHHSGYLHADIKPKNVLLPGNGALKIIDFGQSCPIGHRKERIQGTPDFMAPEQVKRRILDQRTDIFNLGASMYWVLTGQNYPTTMPKGDSASEITVAKPRDVPPPDQLNSECPAALSKLVMDCCNRDRGKRPYDMSEVIPRLDVARHHVLRKRHPERYARGRKRPPKPTDEGQQSKPVSPDDTAGFERFLEDIL